MKGASGGGGPELKKREANQTIKSKLGAGGEGMHSKGS